MINPWKKFRTVIAITELPNFSIIMIMETTKINFQQLIKKYSIRFSRQKISDNPA